MIRSFRLRPLVVALAAVAILIVTVRLEAQSTRKQTLFGETNLGFAGEQFAIFDGSFRHVGNNVTGAGVNIPGSPEDTGTFSLINSRGDRLNFSYHVAPIGPGVWRGRYTILSGTQKFCKASGQGDMSLWRNSPVNGTAIFLNGDLSY